MCGDGVKSTANMLSKGSASPYISHAIQFNETRVDSDYQTTSKVRCFWSNIRFIIPFHVSNYFFRSFHLLVWAGFRRSQSKKVCNEKRKSRKLHSRAILKISFFLAPFLLPVLERYWRLIVISHVRNVFRGKFRAKN